LFHWSYLWVDVKFVLGEFPRDTWHVGWFPCKDVSILTEELDERAFLCGREVCSHSHLLGGISRC
jgi:hypothetical protein